MPPPDPAPDAPDAASGLELEVERLDLLKALGDNTRYAIYLELARAAAPLATADIADTLDLHVNTVRPHLERMREVGLLDVHVDARGAVGRPTNRYALAADAPSLGLEPPTFPLLARMLLRAAGLAGAGATEAADAGREQGAQAATVAAATSSAAGSGGRTSCTTALMGELGRLGFDPAVVTEPGGDGVTIAFAHCPFRDLAEANPQLVCNLHRGMVEGFVASFDDARVVSFGTLVDRRPCQVDLEAVPVGGSAASSG